MQECRGFINYKQRVLQFSEALLDKHMHAAALPQFIFNSLLGNFPLLRKIFRALLEKSTSAHGSSVMTFLRIRMPVQPPAYYTKTKNLLFFFLIKQTS